MFLQFSGQFTKRALIIDLFDRSVGVGEPWYAPYDVYDRKHINVDKEQLAHFVQGL